MAQEDRGTYFYWPREIRVYEREEVEAPRGRVTLLRLQRGLGMLHDVRVALLAEFFQELSCR